MERITEVGRQDEEAERMILTKSSNRNSIQMARESIQDITAMILRVSDLEQSIQAALKPIKGRNGMVLASTFKTLTRDTTGREEDIMNRGMLITGRLSGIMRKQWRKGRQREGSHQRADRREEAESMKMSASHPDLLRIWFQRGADLEIETMTSEKCMRGEDACSWKVLTGGAM
jgi:hypothetical protein